MECSVLFMGPVGAGKTMAVQTLSDIDVAGTEESATDETSAFKPLTTVCMDAGVLELGDGVGLGRHHAGRGGAVGGRRDEGRRVVRCHGGPGFPRG